MHPLPSNANGGTAPVRTADSWILVVDDEMVVRELLQRFLVLEGYRVLVAADGIEALSLFRQHPGLLQAVVLDVLMPRMDGRDAFLAMRDIDPTIPVMVMSGFAPGERAAEIIRQPGTTFIRKPFVLGDVLVGIETLVKGRERESATPRRESTSSTPRLEGITD